MDEVMVIILNPIERNNPKVVDGFYYMTPAEYVIFVFGSINKCALAIGRTRQAVEKWQNPRLARGMAGLVPASVQQKILIYAQEHSLDITPHDLIFGRKVKVKYE